MEPVSELRVELERLGLDGFVLPLADEHLGEYLPDHARRLAWLTGFTGSAGAALVLRDKAVLFVDGRYTLQAGLEVDASLWEIRHLAREGPAKWLAENAPAGRRVGYDPRLHSLNGAERLRQAFAGMVALDANPVDAVWRDRPAPPDAAMEVHPLEYAGMAHADKIAVVASELALRKARATVLNQPESVAWLLNLRGRDVPFTPLALCQAIVSADGAVELFAAPLKAGPEVLAHLGPEVTIRPPAELAAALAALGRAGAAVSLDPDTCNDWIRARLEEAGARVLRHPDPCLLPRACKNPVEIAGMRAAHRRDGRAMARFLALLDRTQPGTLTEAGAAALLEGLRAEGALFRGPSFQTISGFGANGAIVHYRVTPATDRRLEAGGLYLIDSGGQYLDGTTDVTRTVAIGRPDDEMRRHFTLVLKGHIALARIRFPERATGAQLDVLARQFLWQDGLDYDHGTGHGVGSYLGVHEGPQRIASTGTQILKPGMVLSNEPGYYRAGAFGIRIENLVLVARGADGEGGREWLEFETLTLVPIDLALVDAALLSPEERAWLDAYHARVRAEVTPLLADEADRAWLHKATRAVG